MNSDQALIQTLAHSRLFKDYKKAFNELTGLPLVLTSPETFQHPFQACRNENPFCALLRKQNGTCAHCLCHQKRLKDAAGMKPLQITCPFGLSELLVPIRQGSKTIGYLQTGLVVDPSPALLDYCRATAVAQTVGVDFQNERAPESFAQSPVLTPKKLKSIGRMLAIFGEHLSSLSNQLAMEQLHSEPEGISKARKYIEDHSGEEISLKEVSRNVHMSMFYFCKLFKKVTGLHFTEFVSRTRVEKAKALLQHPNQRISEVAYGVGFQSLTQFNRVFKRVEGISPTQYRHQGATGKQPGHPRLRSRKASFSAELVLVEIDR